MKRLLQANQNLTTHREVQTKMLKKNSSTVHNNKLRKTYILKTLTMRIQAIIITIIKVLLENKVILAEIIL